jgi:hypothetical protein
MLTKSIRVLGVSVFGAVVVGAALPTIGATLVLAGLVLRRRGAR